MATYTIGRDPDPAEPRIVLRDKSVSRKHATIGQSSGGGYLLRDLGSTYGTFVREPGGWRRVEQVTVYPDDDVKFGSVVQKVSAVLREAQDGDAKALLGKPERNPETGEIVRRRV